MRIYLIRHGDPNYALDCLTELGKEQAQKLGEYYKDIKFDAIYCSSQGRATETANFLAKPHQITPIRQDWSREDNGGRFFILNLGNDKYQWPFWEPNHIKAFRKTETINRGLKYYEDPSFENDKFKEGFEHMAKLSDEFLESLGLRHDRENNCYRKIKELPGNIALVAHGGFAYSFLSNMLDIPYSIFSTTFQCMDLTAVTIIDFVEVDDRYYGKILRYNDTAHLREKTINSKQVAGI